MPVVGAKPRPGAINTSKPVHEWADVVEVPFDGPVPVELPSTRLLSTPKGSETVEVLPETRAWWAVVCRMPHCVLWREEDWQFALATAFVADLSFRGVTGASTEMRNREKVLGTTRDFRRDLRIRYVPVEPVTNVEPVDVAKVADLDARRARINGS